MLGEQIKRRRFIMFQTLAATGLALSLGFSGMTGIGAASAAEDTSANVDLQTKVEAAIEDGETITKSNLQAWAETNDWEMEDLQVWAEANAMSEGDLQDWAEDNGWSEEDSAKLDLDLSADVNLDNVLDDNDGNSQDEDEGIFDDLLGDIL
jgi:hypothetical protein